MPRNGAGTFSRDYSWVADRDASIPITASRVDADSNDIANALTASIAKDGQTIPTANLPMGTFRHTGVGNGSARTDYGALGQIQDSAVEWGATSGGSANAQTITLTPAITAYVGGQTFRFIAGFTNTGATTLNVNGVGAKAVRSNNVTCVGGEIIAGLVYTVTYDGTTFFTLQSPRSLNPGQTEWGGTSGGSANAQTATLSPALTQYTTGQRVIFKAGFTNTSTATLNPNGLGAKNIFAANAALTGGEIVTNQIYEAVYDGTQFQLVTPIATQRGMLIGKQVFKVAGTSVYVPTVGANTYIAEMVGGGASGGGCAATSGSQWAAAGGGGAGEYATKRGLISAIAGATITVGAGGAAPSAGNNSGNGGGTSSIGAVLTASAGQGGGGGAAQTVAITRIGGNGGTGGSGSDFKSAGQGGTAGIGLTGSAVIGGYGGNGPWGGGGRGDAASGAGVAASGPGAGGAGAANNISGSAVAGGAGNDGIVIIWEFS